MVKVHVTRTVREGATFHISPSYGMAGIYDGIIEVVEVVGYEEVDEVIGYEELIEDYPDIMDDYWVSYKYTDGTMTEIEGVQPHIPLEIFAEHISTI